MAAASENSSGNRTDSGRPEGRSVPHTMVLFHTPRKVGVRERERQNRVLDGQELEG